jgi:hypothetical protein
MEPLDPLPVRTIGIIALALVLMMFGVSFLLTKSVERCPQVHCNMHGQAIACAAVTGA